MEQAVEEAMQRVRIVYEMITGHPAPESSPDAPYARIPPEVDREEHVLRQAAALFERVRELGQKTGAPNVGSDVVSQPTAPFASPIGPIGIYREGSELRFVFDVGNNPREQISVELRGSELRVSSDRPNSSAERGEQRSAPSTADAQRIVQTAYLPVRVDPSAVTAELTEGFLTVRVRMPLIDDAIHKIEIR